MVGHGLLLALAIGVLAAPSAVHTGACSPAQVVTVTCSIDASLGADDVTLVGTSTSPGSGGGAAKGSGHAGARSPFECEVILAARCRGHTGHPGPAVQWPGSSAGPRTR